MIPCSSGLTSFERILRVAGIEKKLQIAKIGTAKTQKCINMGNFSRN
jgi:hypothetical protein